MSNSPNSQDDPAKVDILLAEYALGVLEPAQREQVELSVQNDPALGHTLDRWNERFFSLTEDISPVHPSPHLWPKISKACDFQRFEKRALQEPIPAKFFQSLWGNVLAWRALAIGTSVASLVLASVLVTQNIDPIEKSHFKVANLGRSNAAMAWVATVDIARGEAIVVPIATNDQPAHHDTELWLIPKDGHPIALGVFATNESSVLKLPASTLAQINLGATLAVSIEPKGGSPTGQPTGAVVATGLIKDT